MAPVSLEHLAAGAYHDHHVLRVDGRPVVLRRCIGSQWGLAPAAQLAREHATLEALAPTGIAPAPLALVEDPPLLLEELVEGRAFSYARDLPGLGTALARVHALAPAHLPEVDAHTELLKDGRAWLTRAESADAEAVALVTALGERVAATGAPPAPAVLVHTDLNAGNLLVDGRGVRLLDWEAARRGPAAWDLAHALAPTTTTWSAATACLLDAADARALTDAYLAAGGAPEAVAQLPALMDVVVFRALSWCLGMRAEGPGDPVLAEALSRLVAPEAIVAATRWE